VYILFTATVLYILIGFGSQNVIHVQELKMKQDHPLRLK